MNDVLRALRKEHADISQLLDVLERQAILIERGDRPDFDVIEGVVDYFLSYPNLYHHPKEDLVFRKLIVRSPRLAARVGDLQREHEIEAARTREFAAGIRAAAEEPQARHGPLHQWIRSYVGHERQHMSMEERALFPAAQSALTDQDWADIRTRVTDRDDPLFGPKVGERYSGLHRDILHLARAHRGA